ncbi:hypothetical protein [Magnetospirillum sulfuroxidans]|uniref:Uncharacterized protein n=1 Tax=Magnetospirillum sulfuroxidans TaxID=611300 RepID=A0ABS5ICY1_9PROT|nr:hypothetical protein [Magnetospirillum sulfuroxidans]MBR9971538.1 hypothetical protein [Magnetospirillum sulfuroxidans]
MSSSVAERIQALIDGARHSATNSGQPFDLQKIYVSALVRCGISHEEALSLIADPANDPVGRILHFAGDSHNFAILAVEEALAAA